MVPALFASPMHYCSCHHNMDHSSRAEAMNHGFRPLTMLALGQCDAVIRLPKLNRLELISAIYRASLPYTLNSDPLTSPDQLQEPSAMSTQPLLARTDGLPPFQPETPALARSNRLKLLSTVFITLLLVGGTIWIGAAGERTPDRGDADKLAEYWMRRCVSSPIRRLTGCWGGSGVLRVHQSLGLGCCD
jgi:hypothetical protein